MHFTTSSFPNVPPKPILQVEVPTLFNPQLYFTAFECANTKQYFSNTFQIKFFFHNAHPTPILQVEVAFHFTRNFTLQLF
jgi:hypothetical protein